MEASFWVPFIRNGDSGRYRVGAEIKNYFISYSKFRLRSLPGAFRYKISYLFPPEVFYISSRKSQDILELGEVIEVVGNPPTRILITDYRVPNPSICPNPSHSCKVPRSPHPSASNAYRYCTTARCQIPLRRPTLRWNVTMRPCWQSIR